MSARIWGQGVVTGRQVTSHGRRRVAAFSLTIGLPQFLLLAILLAALPLRADDDPQRAPEPPLPATFVTASRTADMLDPMAPADWHPTLVRDRKLEARFRVVRKEFDSGRVTQGLTGLQSLLDLPQDSFLRSETGGMPVGAHRLAGELLSAAPPETLVTYELLYAAEAQRLLERSIKERDSALLRDVVRRFFHTPAGFAALDHLSSRALDVGDYSLAAAGFRRLLHEPVHRQRVTRVMRIKAALSSQRCGEVETARKIVMELGNLPITVGGQHLSPQLWFKQLAAPVLVASGETRVVGGSPSRNGTSVGTAPAFGYPVWSISLADTGSRHLESVIGAWVDEQQQEGLPLGMAHFPLAVGNLLLFRDFEGIRAVESDSGRTAWAFRGESSLARDIPAQNPMGNGGPDSGTLLRQLVGNWTLGMLASDGRRVFAIDQLESNWNQRGIIPSQVDDPQAASRQANRLVAINLQQAEGAAVAPAWWLGGNLEATPEGQTDENAGRNRRLAGHFFLGPPLPLDGRLYVVTEWRQQMYLTCLRSEDGDLLWQQELCAVPLPVSLDQARYYLACAPAYSDGVLVCPTHSGMLAAVDPLTGELLWSSSYDDIDQQQRLTAAPYVPRTRFGHAGYPNLPLVHDGKVIYLPAHSEAICCFDLHTGKLLWRVRREDFEQAIEYIAAAEDNRVLVVGRRRCRGLSLKDGAELWSFPLTSVPAGRGCRANGSYLIPLSEGTILSLDLRSGLRTGFALPRGETRPGNLLVHGELVVSLGGHEIHAYPQAGPWLKKMGATAATRPSYPGQLLLSAELELAVGKTAAARQHLQEVLVSPVSPDSGQRAEHLLRELLYAEIPGATAGQPEMLGQLARLSTTPEQTGRLLSFQSEFYRKQKNVPALIATARELSALAIATPLTLDQDPSRRITSTSLSRQILESVRTSRDLTPALERHVENELAMAIAAKNVDRLRQLTLVYADWPAAEAAQIELARMLSRRGDDQQAELLLLKCCDSRRADVFSAATMRLIDLYNEQGLHHEAGECMHRLAERSASQNGKFARDVNAYLAAFSRKHPAWEVYSRLAEPELKCSKVRIEESRWPNDALQSVYNGTGMQFLNTPRGFGFDLIDEGRGDDGQLISIHRHSGPEPDLRLGALPRVDRVSTETPQPPRIGTKITLPPRYYYPVQPQQTFVGHFFAIGSAGNAHGVSLLENRVTWKVPLGLSNRAEVVRVGPAGATFAVFQCRQHLFAVDPARGELLWQRNDLETCSGLSVDPFSGLFGDERVLVLFAADRVHYTVYDTASGGELRRGRLDISSQQNRKTFGRLLFHFTNAAQGRKLRVWDPLTDQVVWQEEADRLLDVSINAGMPTGTKIYSFVMGTDELAYLTTDGRLKIVDVQRAKVQIDRPWFDASRPSTARMRDLGFLRVCCDHSRYYVNLQLVQPPGESTALNSFIISDTPLPAMHIGGELSAVQRGSGQVLWTRDMDSCSILQFPELKLPVLVTASRVHRGSQLALRLEVLQAHTGESVAMHDRLLADRLLQHSYNRSPRSLELRSSKATIRVDLDFNSAQ